MKPSILKKFASGIASKPNAKPPASIEKLFAQLRENEKKLNWLDSLTATATAIRSEHEKARTNAQENPNSETVKTYVATRLKLTEAEAYSASHSLCAGELVKGINSTIPAVLCPALEDVIAILQARLEEVSKADIEQAKSLGLPPEEVSSPVLEKLNFDLTRARNWLERVANRETQIFSSAINFVRAAVGE